MSYTYKNWCKTPTFEDGDTGYWSDGPSATVSASTDKFVTGRTKSLKMTLNGTPGGASAVAVTPTGSAGIPVRMGEALRFSAWGARGALTYSGGGSHNIGPFYLRGHIQDAAGTTLQTVQLQVSMSNSGTSMARSTGGTTNLIANQAGYLVLDVYNAGNSDGGSVYIDGIQVELRDQYNVFGTATAGFFDGDSADDNHFSYAWDGTAGNSYSTATMIHSVSGPPVATIGSPVTVTGSGFVPGEAVTVSIAQPYGPGSVHVETTADGSGNVSVEGTPPVGTSYPGLLRYMAIGASDTLYAIQLAALRSPAVTSTTVTNLFPNPEVVTLADATRPKHFWQYYNPAAIEVTRTGAAGSEAVLLAQDPGREGTALTLGETEDDAFTCGVSVGKAFMVSLTVTTPVNLNPGESFYLNPDVQLGDEYNSNTSTALAAGSVRLHAPFHARSDSAWASLYLWADSLEAGRELTVDKIQLTEVSQWYRGFLPTETGTMDLAPMGLQAGRSYYVRSNRSSNVTQTGDTFEILAGPDEDNLTAVHSRDVADSHLWHEVEIPADAVIIRAVGSMTKQSLTWPWQIEIFDAPLDFFSGATADGGGYSYEWAGTAHDSASIRTEAAGLTGQIFIDGTGVPISEMRIVIAGSLVNITQIGD